MHCIVVTPEKAEIDERAEFVVLPMVDGEYGIQKDHTPLIGRVGQGELRLTINGQIRKYRISGGFAQVRSNVITVLTTKVERM